MSTITKPRVPDGLRELMKDLTREILKEKPTDIYDFAESYFQSRLPEKENYAVKSFEESSGKYDFSYIQNPQRYQIPVALVYSIIPEGLTNLIKDLIKAVLREQPTNLCDFAVEYFRHIKAATCKESQAETKEINYSAYEKYFMNKERFLFTPYVKCTCGRTLGEAYSNNSQIEHLIAIHKIQNNDSTFLSKSLVVDDSNNNNNLNKITENDTIYNENYMNSIYIIQRYIRRYLKGKKDTTKTNQVSPNHKTFDHHSVTAKPIITKQYEHTSQIPIVPQLQLNQNESENISEDASYNSASTAVLSTSESGRETSEPSMFENIVTKTIMEDVEMENDEKNISSQSTRNHVQDDTSTNNNEKEGVNNVNDADGSKDSAKSLDYIMDSRNEEFDSKEIETMKNLNESGETNEQPVEDIDIKGKTNVESKTGIEAINAAVSSIETGNVNLTQPEIFNINIEKTNEKTSDIGELHKISVDVHDADIKNHDNDLKKDKSFSEHELIAENKITEHDNNSNESTEADDKEFSKEVDQADLTGSFGNNNLETVDKYPMLEITKISKDEQSQNLDKQKDKVNTKSELLEEIPRNELDEDSIRQSADDFNEHNSHAKTESKTNDGKNINEVKNEKNSNKAELLESIKEKTSDDNKSDIETNEEDNDAEKLSKDSDNNVKKEDVDDSFNKKLSDFDRPTNVKEEMPTQLDTNNSASTIIASNPKFEGDIMLGETKEADLGNLADQMLKSKNDFVEKALDMKLDKSILIQPKNNDDGKTSESTKNDDEMKLENEKFKIDGTTITHKIDEIITESEFDKNVNNTNKLGDVASNKQETSRATAEYELNKNSDLTDQTPLQQKTDTSIVVREKSPTKSSDSNDKNLIEKSEIILDKGNSPIMLDKEMDLKHDKKSDDTIELNELGNKPILIQQKNNDEGKTSELTKTDFENESENEKFDTDETTMTNKTDKIITESEFDKNVNNENKSEDVASNNQETSRATAEDELNKNSDLTDQNSLQEKNTTNTNIAVREKSPTESNDTNETDNNLIGKSEIVSNMLDKEIDLTHDKISDDKFKIKYDINKNLNKTSEEIEKEINDGKKIDVEKQDRNIEESQRNELADSTNKNISVDTDDKVLSETKMDEKYSNQGENDQTELKMQDSNTQNLMNYNINLNTKSEQSIVDAVEKRAKNELDNDLKRVFKSKSDEIMNNSDEIGSKANVNMNKYNRTSHTSDEANYNDNKVDISSNLDNNGLNTVEEKSLIESKIKDEITDINNRGNVKENITLVEKNTNTDDMKFNKEFIQTEIETKVVPDELNEILENDKNPKKHEVDKIIESSIEVDNNKKVATSVQEPTKVDLNEKTKESLNMHMEKECDNNMGVKETEIENSGYNKNLECSFKMDLDNNTTSKNENITLTSENLTQEQQSESNIANAAIEPTNQKETKIIENKKNIQTDVESSRNDNDIKTEKYVTTDDQEPTHVDLNEKTIESLNMNIEKDSVSVKDTEIDNSEYGKNLEGSFKTSLDKNTSSIEENINLTSENLTQKHQSESNLTNTAIEPEIIQKEYIQTEIESHRNDNDFKTEEHVTANVQEPNQVDLNEKTNESLNMNIEKESDNNVGDIETEIDNSGYDKIALDKNTTSMVENINMTSENLTQKQQSESNLTNAALEPTNQEEINILQKENIQTEVKSRKNDTDIKTEEDDVNKTNVIYENSKDIPAIKTNSELLMEPSDENLLEYKNSSTNYISSDLQNKNVDTKPELQFRSNDDEFESRVQNELNTHLPKTSQTEQNETNYKENIDQNANYNLDESTAKTNLKDELSKKFTENKNETATSDASEVSKEISPSKLEDKRDNKFESDLKIDHTLNKTEKLTAINNSNLLKESSQTKSDEICNESCVEIIKKSETDDIVNTTNANNKDKFSSVMQETKLDSFDANSINISNNKDETTNNENVKTILKDSSINDSNMTDELIDKTFTLKSSGSIDNEEVNRNLVETLQTELDKNKTNVNVDNTIADAHVTEEIITKNCAQETQAEKHLNEGKETTTNIRNIEPSENDIDVGTDKQTTDPDDITSSEISSKQLVDSSEKSINRAKQPTKDASSISENENYIKSETVISDTNEHCDNITTENQESVSTSNKHQNTNLSEAIIEKCDTKHPVSELYGTDTGASTNSLSIENEQSQPFEIQSDISKQEKSINDDYEQKEIKSNSFTKRADERRNTTNESNSGEDQELIVENKTKSQEQQLGNLDVAYSDSIEANDGNIGTTNSAGHEQNNQANSDVIKANYKDMDTINSSDDTAGIVTDDRINNTLQLKNDSNTSFSNDIIEHETETKQIQEPQESEPEIETNKSSLEFSNNKLHLEDKPLKDLNEVNQDIQTISKYQESSEGHEKKSSITLDTNIAQNDEEKTNFDIKTRNSIQIEQDLNDDQGVRDNHKEENNQNTEINMDDSNSELIAEKSSNLEDNVIKTNSNNENIHDDKEISKISLKSEEIETHNDEDFNSQSRNKREVENDQNSEHKDSNELSDTKQIITIHDDDELKQMSGENPVLRLTDENVIGENVHSNKGETIQQDSIENISDSSEVKTPLNVLEIETPSEQDSVSTDYIKTSSVNVNDQEINSQTIFSDNKSLDLNMNKLQSSVSDTEVSSLDVHQQQSTLENEQNPENEVNAENQKHTGASSSFPLEKESIYKESPSNLIKSSSSNKLEDNQPNKIEKENVDPSTVKHIEKIESTSNEISNIQQDVTLDGTSKDNTLENNSNYELLSTEEIQEHQENESNNKIEAKTSNLNSSIDQTFHGDQKDKLHTENINENETVHQYKVDRENIIEGTQADAKDIKTANVNESSQEDFKQENTVQRNTNVTAETTNNEETTQNIGIQTSETFIGNQNLTIGRIRNFNEGLLGSISGQRFAETHLKSFWKEYVMNNSMPLSQYDYKENEPKEQPAAGTSRQQNMNQVNETNLSANKSEEQTIDIIEPEIIKETIKQSESSPVKNENISTANNDSTPSKDIERIPRYFYGVPDTEPSHSSSCSKRKSYKEPTAFTIAIGDLNKKHNTKIAKTVEGLSPKSNKDVECQKSDIKHNLTKFDLSDKVYAEPLLESETPPKVFQDLNEFEYEIHDIDLDITYTIDEIIRLKIENDSQNNSDDNDANETSEYSLTPEPMLQTIVELSESETPKPPDQLHSIDDDFLANLERISDTTSTSWTTGSKEDNSFISDEFLDEKSQSEYIKQVHTTSDSKHKTQGGIYEFSKDDMAGKVLKSQDYEEIIAQAPTPPNDDPFYEDLKETAAKTIQEAYRQFKQKNMLKPVENISKLKGETEISNNGSNTEKLNNKNDENLTSFEDDESKEKDVKATNSEQEFENTENLTCHDINNFECKQLEKYVNNTTISNLNEDDKNDSNKSTEIDIASATKKSMKGLNGEVFPNNSNTESSKNTKDITTIDLEFDENDKSQKLVKNETSTENLTEVFSNKVATSSRDRPSSNNIGDSNIDKDLAINEYDVNDVNSNNLANQTMKIDPKSPVEVLGYSNIDKDVAINEYDVNDVNSNDLTNQTMKIDLKSPVEEYVKELNSENAISNTNIESSNNIKDTNINVTNRDPTISEDNESQNLGGNESIKNFNVTSTENLKENLYSEVSSADKKNTNNIIDVNKDVSDKDLLNSMTNQPIETNIESLADKHKEEFSTEVAGNFVLKETSNNNIKDTNSNITNTDPTISKYNESQNLGVNESIKNFNVTSTENLKENLYSEVSSADKKSTNNIIDVNNDNLLNAMTNQTIETNKESLADKLKEEFSTDAAGSLVLKESSNNKDANIDITNKDLTFSINDKSDINSNDFINQTKEMDIKSSAEKFKELATSGSNRESSNNINDTIIDVTTEDLTFKEYDKNDIKLNQSTNQTKQIESSKSENMRADSTNDAKLISHNSENKASEMPNSSNISKDNEITKYSCNNKDGTSFVNNNDLKELLTECDKTIHDDLHSDHIYFEPTAPAEEDIQSVVSIDSLQSNEILQDQAARKIQNAVKNFIERKSKLSSNLGTTKESLKSNWFLGDEPIIANESLPKTTSQISFEETEAYVELTTNPPQYLVDSSSNLEAIDANNFSRSPTAPVTNRSRNSVDLANDQSDNVSKDTVSVIGKDAGVIENTNTEHSQVNANNSTYRILSEDKVDEKQAIKCPNLIDQFLNSERHYSEAVNHHNKDTIFTSPDITEITKILSNFTDSQKEQYDSVIPYERLEEPCIKKSARIIGDDVKDAVIIADTAINTDNSSSSDIDDTEDSLSTKTVKLHKPDAAITKMQQRRDSTTKISNLDKPKDYNFDEPSVVPIDNLDTDEEGIVVNKLQREETRESSAQSDFDVIIGGDKDDNFSFLDSINIDETFPSKGSLKRVHTIAGEGDSKSLLKNVTIDESIKYIEPPDYELNSGSLCLDDDTAENIRRKMLAYSFSEADSDCVDKSPNTNDGNNFESKSQKYDDFNVSTALVENIDSSTETESTIVSAVTKIQAGARGYLTRKRLGKASMASDGKSIAHDDINKASFGNAAISESLEYLVQEAAAKRIQKVFRQHYRKKLAEVNQKEDDSFSPEFTTSLESTLAQKRSIMLQRGDALRNDSTPDEGNSSSNGSGSENGKLNAKIDSKSQNKNLFVNDETNNFDKQHLEKNTGGNDTLKATSTAKTAATIRAKKIEENKIRWLAMRQNSMPVQIDSEVLRVIPKYMRKKIKSAEGEKKKDRRQVLMD